jgi:hypothetical protein
MNEKRNGKIKLPDGQLIYDTNTRGYILLGNVTVFYDGEYNLIRRVPALKYCKNLQIVDDKLYYFTFTSSRKVALYDYSANEVIKSFSLNGKTGLLYAENSFFIDADTLLLLGWHQVDGAERNRYVIEKYCISKKAFTEIVQVRNRCICCFKEGADCYFITLDIIGNARLYKVDENFNVTSYPIERKMKSITHFRYDPTARAVVQVDIFKAWNAPYGEGDADYCIDLKGGVAPWTPPKKRIFDA